MEAAWEDNSFPWIPETTTTVAPEESSKDDHDPFAPDIFDKETTTTTQPVVPDPFVTSGTLNGVGALNGVALGGMIYDEENEEITVEEVIDEKGDLI